MMHPVSNCPLVIQVAYLSRPGAQKSNRLSPTFIANLRETTGWLSARSSWTTVSIYTAALLV